MRTYFRILTYVKKYAKYLAASILFTLIFSLMSGASVYLSIPLLSTLFQEGNKAEVVQTVPTQTMPAAESIVPHGIAESWANLKLQVHDYIFTGTQQDILIKIVVLILLAFLIKNISGYLQSYFLAYVEQAVIRDLRNQIFAHLHKLPMTFFKHERTGNLISRITNDTVIIQQSISAVFLNLIREPITIVVFLAIAVSISFKLTLFSFIILPFSIGIIAYIGSILRKQSSILQAKMADITSIIHETVTGIKIVKAFGMEKFEEDRFKRETEKFFRTILKMVRVRNAASPLTEFLTVGVGTAIIYYGGELVLVDKSLSASEFMGFLFAIFQIIQPIKELSSVNNRIQESSAAADRVFKIIDIEPDIRDSEDSVEKTNFEDSIRLEHVWFKYDDGDDYVLKDINLEVKKGEIVAVVGSSGGGKTTLVDLIPRFFDVTKGSILLDEVNIKNIKISSIKQLIGVVTQETILFNDSVRNNIAYGLTDIPDEKIIEVAKAANAHKFIMELPEGLDTVIGERGVRLSGGQRQRISIARALLKNPPIMILDEATSSLDNESEVLVQAAIERLMEERTVIVIAHRLSTIRNSSKIIVLDGGEIVQSGTHDELVADEQSIYKMLYDLQFRIDSESDE